MKLTLHRRSIFGTPLLSPNHRFAYSVSLVMLFLDSTYSAFIVRHAPDPLGTSQT